MRSNRLVLPVLAALASVTAFAGAVALIDFDSAPGVQARAPGNWPALSAVAKSPNRPQIVVFAHPKCSCTRATLEELSQIEEANNAADIAVLFYRSGPESTWSEGPSWKRAAHIGNTTVSWDDAGQEAKRFGSATSGTVLLYSTAGKLLFGGGITASRGHVGENLGALKLVAALRTGKPQQVPPPVFGCGLFGESGVAFL